MNTAAIPLPGRTNPSQISEWAAWLAILTTVATILLLTTLHILSPEFSPSWRVVSEYAFGHYPWVLSLMFLSWGTAHLRSVKPTTHTKEKDLDRIEHPLYKRYRHFAGRNRRLG